MNRTAPPSLPGDSMDGTDPAREQKPLTPEFLRIRSHRAVWITTALVTVAMILWFAFTIEPAAFIGILERAGPGVILFTVSCMLVNAGLVICWMMLIVGGSAGIAGASRVVAWQMFAATILPARLGDLAWMYFIHRWMGVPGGRAVFIALYHRLQDTIVVSAIFLIGIAALGAQIFGANVGLLVTAIFVLVVGIVFSLQQLLTWAAKIMRRLDEALDARIVHVAYHHVLQVRVWYRHGVTPAVLWGTFGIIVARWLALLTGLAVLMHGALPELDWLDSIFATSTYFILGIVPLQSIGGFGVGEAGVAWLLTFYGVSLAAASSMGFVLRLLVNIVHTALFVVVMLALGITQPRAAVAPRS